MIECSPRSPCPCGRQDARQCVRHFGDCCGPHLASLGRDVADAETLMRSRYTAYVTGHLAHLRATWHPSTCPASLEPEEGVTWLGLTVKQHRPIDDQHAEVSFVARYRVQGRGQRMTETSRFVREGGRWFYVDGDVGP